MASLFASLERVAGATVDAVFAEEFILTPRRKTSGDVNARAGANGYQPSYAFTGVFSCDGKPMHADGRGKADNATAAMIAAPPFVDAFASAFPVRPELDWHVLRGGTAETFRIADVKDVEGGRLLIALTRQA